MLKKKFYIPIVALFLVICTIGLLALLSDLHKEPIKIYKTVFPEKRPRAATADRSAVSSQSDTAVPGPPSHAPEPETFSPESPEATEVVSIDAETPILATDVSDLPGTSEVAKSGDFKTTPDGYPLTPYWDYPSERQADWSYDHKLIDHVLVKLYREGVQNIEGGSIDDARRVRPHYTNTLYVEWDEATNADGVKQKYIASSFGAAGIWIPEGFFDLPPPSVNLIDLNSPEGQGIDPYTFLSSQELPK